MPTPRLRTWLLQCNVFRLHVPAADFEVGRAFAKIEGAIAHANGARLPGEQ